MFDFSKSVAAEFRMGRGKLVLASAMSDREIVSRIRIALAVSEGRPFSVLHCSGEPGKPGELLDQQETSDR